MNQDPQAFSKNIELAMTFITNSVKKGGRFGSTQSTVLSLKALVKYTQLNPGVKGSGKFVFYVNGIKTKSVVFNETKPLSMDDLDFSQEFYNA